MGAQWIWNFGDYEIYHSLLLHARRQEFGHDYPAFWHTDSPEKTVSFRWRGHAAAPGYLIARACGKGYAEVKGKMYPLGARVPLPQGECAVHIRVVHVEGLPSVYVESDICPSGADWQASPQRDTGFLPVGTSAAHASPDKTPEVFPFSYAPLTPVSREKTAEGTLYDFGRESFGPVSLTAAEGEEITVVYGESREEALDQENAILWERVQGKSAYVLAPRAFRFLHVKGEAQVSAQLEYTPLPYRGAFSCPDEKMNRIWALSAYTFHLNSREFFLDGIKRDRWVWSGDAYQSYMINRYLFFDEAIARRTILALRGKNEVREHINTILDYSLYWLISVWDYYQAYGDAEFVRLLLPKMRSLLAFVEKDRDEHGFIVGGEGVWVFIDWSEMDKTGALCAEQMLYVRALQAMGLCESLAGEGGEALLARAEKMRALVNEYFWDAEKGAFIDSFSSGRRHVTRHANIFAVLFDLAAPERQKSILENVLHNAAVTALTTPYFKFFEMDALCKLGCQEEVTKAVRAYWGGMVDLGATSIWEQFDPNAQGVEHYAMYGSRFACSLCHAWGAGPIYLLGRYYLGVRPTAPRYAAFEVAPSLGGLPAIEGAVPLPEGEVRVALDERSLRVTASCPGGVLRWQGREYPLIPGKEIALDF